MEINKIISNMSIAEKALICVGRNFWFVRGLKRLGINSYMVSDGPHGLRKQDINATDHLGVNESVKATCFPTAVTMASSWDMDLIKKCGEKIAEEALSENLGILLGPGINIKRSPLCGRNFEYFSEDPFLTGHMAKNFILGVQSKGIGTSLKHFAVNNQETDRLRINAVVDERALREIYLYGFEIAVKEAKPYTLMCAYNRLNGDFCSENKYLLQDILRGEWGFDGYVMTDWGAINDRVKALKAGLELEMPGCDENIFKIINAISDKSLSIEILDKAVYRLLSIYEKIFERKNVVKEYDKEIHHNFAEKAAIESAVLLKNENFFPIAKDEEIIILGELFEIARYQGNGSSLINSHKVDTSKDVFEKNEVKFKYAKGYAVSKDVVDDKMIANAVGIAEKATKILIFAGLTALYESEGYDRQHMQLPKNQLEMIKAVTAVNKNVGIILVGGSPIEMPFIMDIKGILNMYLTGQAQGGAVYKLAFGEYSPSGKLAETFPLSVKDAPCFTYFPEGSTTVEYRESIFVGYRYYQTLNKEVLFPFGFGLSYTKFEYSNLTIDVNGYDIIVSLDVKNIGAMDGKEIVQLYISKNDSKILRSNLEMKGFYKVSLKASETKPIAIKLNKRSFSFYSVADKSWKVEDGSYTLKIGKDCQNILLSQSVILDGDDFIQTKALSNKGYLKDNNGVNFVDDDSFSLVLGAKIPSKERPLLPINYDSSASEAKVKWGGRVLNRAMLIGADFAIKPKDDNSKMMNTFLKEMMKTNTFRSFVTTTSGNLTYQTLDGVVEMINGKFFKGLRQVVKGQKKAKFLKKETAKIENGEI